MREQQDTTQPAGGSPVERVVRPRAWAHGAHIAMPWPDMPEPDVMRAKGWTALYDQAALDAAIAAADREWYAKLEHADARVEALSKALREALEFQSAKDGPTIHDWGRWRRVADDAA